MFTLESPSLEILHRTFMVDGQSGTPLHRQLRCALTKAIDEHFEDGQQFWTEHVIIEQLNLSRITVRRALDDLAREGMLKRTPRRGSFVLKQNPGELLPSVGVFVPDWGSDIQTAMLEQLATVCGGQKRQMHVYHTHKGEMVAAALRGLERPPLRENILLIGNPHETTIELSSKLKERGYRIVNMAGQAEGLNIPCVTIDDAEGIRLGVEHLVSLGHRRILFLINEPIANGSIRLRVQAFEQELTRHALNESQIFDCGTQYWDDSFAAAYNKMPEVWALQPTAIFAVSDPGAWAVGKWFAENGIRVPSEVSVLGFDDARPSRFMHPSLTTIAHPLAEIVQRSIELLSEESPDSGVELLHPKLIVRQSTSTPPQS